MKQYVPTIGDGIIQNIIYSKKIRDISKVYDKILQENPTIRTINRAVTNFVNKHPEYAEPEHVSIITAILVYKAIESQLEVEEMERNIKI